MPLMECLVNENSALADAPFLFVYFYVVLCGISMRSFGEARSLLEQVPAVGLRLS